MSKIATLAALAALLTISLACSPDGNNDVPIEDSSSMSDDANSSGDGGDGEKVDFCVHYYSRYKFDFSVYLFQYKIAK